MVAGHPYAFLLQPNARRGAFRSLLAAVADPGAALRGVGHDKPSRGDERLNARLEIANNVANLTRTAGYARPRSSSHELVDAECDDVTSDEAVTAILALDLGTRTGYAIRENGRVESGVQVFDVSAASRRGCAYLRFNRWLDDVCRAASMPSSAGTLWRSGSSFTNRLTTREAPRRRSPPVSPPGRKSLCSARPRARRRPLGTLKKLPPAGQRQEAGDDRSRASTLRLPGRDDNEADALWLLAYAEAVILPPLAVPSVPRTQAG